MSSKKFDWITVKEVAGGYIRFVVMAGLGCHIIKSQAKLIEAIYIGKITDWRVILVVQTSLMIEMGLLIVAYMKLGINTKLADTDVYVKKLSLQANIAGQNIKADYESAKKD
jgi:hypothetical protein